MGGGIGPDWEAWEGVPLPVERSNFWKEPYAELFDWYPWLRPFYTKWEIEHDCEPVRVCVCPRLNFCLLARGCSVCCVWSRFEFVGARKDFVVDASTSGLGRRFISQRG